MLTYTQVLYRSLKISAILLVVDWIGVFLFRSHIYPYEFFGDLLLIETAALFLVAGILDLGSSVGFAGFRKLFFTQTRRASEESFSASKRKDTERRALVLVVSGSTLFVILVLLAVFSAGK